MEEEQLIIIFKSGRNIDLDILLMVKRQDLDNSKNVSHTRILFNNLKHDLNS